jgi:hypothetical protein
MTDSSCIQVIASVARIVTLADGGIRATLDLPEDAIQVAAWLMECKRRGVALAMSMASIEAADKREGMGWIATMTSDIGE